MSACPVCVAEVSSYRWNEGLNGPLLVGFLLFALGLPLLGYVFMFLDIRRYLRSLRRALVMVAEAMPGMAYWAAIRSRPPCLIALDLRLPCGEQEVLAAYRERVKLLHPDRGGDLQKFLKLQRDFERAMHLVRGNAQAGAGSAE